MESLEQVSLKNLGSNIMHSVAEVLADSDFISRTIGMTNSYNEIMFIIQSLGREPVSLLGKDYPFIFDHVRRNYLQGTYVMDKEYDCPKFTFYKELPTVRFADPYTDPNFLIDKWLPKFDTESTRKVGTSRHYSESNDDKTNNKKIDNFGANNGTRTSSVESYGPALKTCDLIGKTNSNFNHGKYRTLVARFHTNSEDSKDNTNPTQTAITEKYGMSHGRNLLKTTPDTPNGYDNPYCRVWTYHHQYHTLNDAIRPFGGIGTKKDLEKEETVGDSGIGFRTLGTDDGNFKGGSERLDKYGVLNYKTGLINMAPTAKIKDYFDEKIDDNSDEDKISIKKCMFSIENLAWKDTKNTKMYEFETGGLSAEQKGPLGGRIMWFPPYNLTFNEDVSVNWNQNQFIGRGESIYTYTNTERRGTIGFTLLIDHPSVVDYWTREGRDGNKLAEGNSGGVDNISNEENTLLRFFAGCDVLMAKPQEFYQKHIEKIKEEEKKEEPPVQENPPAPEEVKPKSKVLYCLLYYPNNYSGQDDTPNGSNGVVNAVDYLMNGIGTQKHVVPSYCHNCKNEWFPTEEELRESMKNHEPLTCPHCGGKNTVKNLDSVDFAVDRKNNVEVESTTPFPIGYFGGYEVRSNHGISVSQAQPEKNYNTIKKTYADLASNEKKGQYLTDYDGEPIIAGYNGKEKYKLAKQIGSEALSLGSAKGNNAGGVSNYVAKSPYQWYRKRWFYRVDKDTENQKLTLPTSTSEQVNYLDTTSYQYNGNGFDSQLDYLKTAFGIKHDAEDHDIIAFTDLYVGLENEFSINTMLKGCYNEDRVKTLVRPFIENKDSVKVTKITFYGHASVQGNNKSDEVNKTRNNKLAKYRALTFKSWMASKGFPGVEDAQIEFKNGVQQSGNKDDVNDPITKIWRSASVVIEYDVTSVTNAATTELPMVEEIIDGEGKPTGVFQEVTVRTDVDNGEQSPKVGRSPFEASQSIIMETIQKANQKQANQLGTKNGGILGRLGIDNLIQDNPQKTPITADDGNILEKAVDEPKGPKVTRIETIMKGTVNRYDNEGEFFKLLQRNDPFLHHQISEKVKYFDPAFHSISPEGFNARLTFLHQCTRQGSTIENSAFESGTAYNLAFGRPPVCVLRLGDFYYTKILINSLSIQFEQAQWDLNPEGIGVMPMFANITLGFVFIGGSDLAGPISRLQNAVSFNYYANTSVYDNRAEMVRYAADKSGKEVAFKGFRYPNTPNEKGMTIVSRTVKNSDEK